MKKHYCFAGIEFTIHIPEDKMYDVERHLQAFRVDQVTDPHNFRFEPVDALDPPLGDL